MIIPKYEKRNIRSIETKIGELEYNRINSIVKSGLYISPSDFVRKAIIDKLKTIDIIEIRDIPKEQARKEIYEYCRENQKTTLSKIAEDLQLDIFEVNEILTELISNGNLKER